MCNVKVSPFPPFIVNPKVLIPKVVSTNANYSISHVVVNSVGLGHHIYKLEVTNVPPNLYLGIVETLLEMRATSIEMHVVVLPRFFH